jgi:hypothetical protein
MSDFSNSTDTVTLFEGAIMPNIILLPEGEEDDFTNMDQVPWNLISADDPGSFFAFADDASIHAAMVGAPLPPGLLVGPNPAASANNLKNW